MATTYPVPEAATTPMAPMPTTNIGIASLDRLWMNPSTSVLYSARRAAMKTESVTRFTVAKTQMTIRTTE